MKVTLDLCLKVKNDTASGGVQSCQGVIRKAKVGLRKAHITGGELKEGCKSVLFVQELLWDPRRKYSFSWLSTRVMCFLFYKEMIISTKPSDKDDHHARSTSFLDQLGHTLRQPWVAEDTCCLSGNTFFQTLGLLPLQLGLFAPAYLLYLCGPVF